MNVIKLSLFILILFSSCTNEEYISKSNILEKLEVTDDDSYRKYYLELNKLNLSKIEKCAIEKQRAIKELQKNSLTFCLNYYPDYAEELIDILKKEYNIKSIITPLNDIVSNSDSTNYENCYQKIMDSILDKRFGVNFIKTQSNRANKKYHLKNKDSIFNFSNSTEFKSFVSSPKYKKFEDSIIKILNKHIIYPKSYISKNNNSYLSADFTVTKKGLIKDLVIESKLDTVNNKHKLNLEEQLEDYLKSINWMPFEAFESKIKVKEHFTYYLK